MSDSDHKEKPAISGSETGPLIVRNLENLRNSKGEDISTGNRPGFALCRCGQSANKPFCDGTHGKVGFSGRNAKEPAPSPRIDYAGKNITIHDDRTRCAHVGFCTERLAAVFRLKEEPWIDPEGAAAEEIVAAVNRCPSGALSYAIDGVESRSGGGEPSITVSKDGPYFVVGDISLGVAPHGQTAPSNRYALCRCGASENKPFCDGSHWRVKFRDEAN